MIRHRDLWSALEVDKDLCSAVVFAAVDPGETTGLVLGVVTVRDLVTRGSEALCNGGLRQYQVPLYRDDPHHGALSMFHSESYQVDQVAAQINEHFMDHPDCPAQSGVSVAKHIRRVVVCEDFVLRERSKSRNLLSPVRITSVLMDRLNRSRALVDVCMQSPSDKAIVNDYMLKKRGFYLPGRPHSNDAARHALLFLRKISVR